MKLDKSVVMVDLNFKFNSRANDKLIKIIEKLSPIMMLSDFLLGYRQKLGYGFPNITMNCKLKSSMPELIKGLAALIIAG